MNKLPTREGYNEIVYDADEEGNIIEKMQKCVMCSSPAFFIAIETNEPLCIRCRLNNDEARRRR